MAGVLDGEEIGPLITGGGGGIGGATAWPLSAKARASRLPIVSAETSAGEQPCPGQCRGRPSDIAVGRTSPAKRMPRMLECVERDLAAHSLDPPARFQQPGIAGGHVDSRGEERSRNGSLRRPSTADSGQPQGCGCALRHECPR